MLSLGRRSAPLPAPPPPPPPPAATHDPKSEKVSAATLDRLRSTFLTTASRGSVYDHYTLGHTLGASRPRPGGEAPRAEHHAVGAPRQRQRALRQPAPPAAVRRAGAQGLTRRARQARAATPS